jgi:hypothetical protein
MIPIKSIRFHHGIHGFFTLPWISTASKSQVLHSVFFGLGVTGDLPKPWDEGEIYWENGGLT